MKHTRNLSVVASIYAEFFCAAVACAVFCLAGNLFVEQCCLPSGTGGHIAVPCCLSQTSLVMSAYV